MHAGRGAQFRALGWGKTALWPDQDRGRGRGQGRGLTCICERFICPDQGASLGPVLQDAREGFQRGHFGDIGATALLGSFDSMGLQPVLPDAFGICELCLNRQDARSAQLGGLFDNEISTRFLYGRKNKPQVRGHTLGGRLAQTDCQGPAPSDFGNLGQPFAIATVEQGNLRACSLAQDIGQIMRMCLRQGYPLPLTQRLLYKEANFRTDDTAVHEAKTMTGNDQRPEGAAQDDSVADAYSANWVDLYAPPNAKPYLRLSRADRPIGTWLLLLPCWWGVFLGAAAFPETAGWLTIWIFAGCALGAFLMRGAGCTWNDITDRDIDDKVARTRSRPIPSGQVTLRQAGIWMAVQAGIAALILFTFNWAAIGLGVLSLGLVAIYPFAKRFTWWPQVFLGLAFNWGALLAWTAQTGSIGLPALFLYLAGISWTLFYDTIYAHMDREDDELIGVKSTARLFAENTETWLRGFLVVTVVLMSLSVIYALAPLANPLKMSLGLAGAWAMGWHMNWQLGKLDINNTQMCLRLFRSNRDAGLLAALFLAITIFV